MLSFRSWYDPESAEDQLSLDPAKSAFDDAVIYFKTKLSNDPRKKDWLDNMTSMQDVEVFISKAAGDYKKRKGSSKARTALSKFSKRVMFYGRIMDTLSQHHPEYVSLAWGAMRFMFVAILNQEELVATLADGLCVIANALPCTELAMLVYPTKRVKHAVATLYAHILRFLMRALDWYQESKLAHIIHSITRPAELRYKDLLDEISNSSRTIDQLTRAGQQAEQRDIHELVRLLLTQQMSHQQENNTQLQELKGLVTNQSLISSGSINTNQYIPDTKFTEIVALLSSARISGPDETLIYCHQVLRRQRNERKPLLKIMAHSKQFGNWNHLNNSSLLLVRGKYRKRFQVKDLCLDMIATIRSASMPVIFALKTTIQITPKEVLKYMILQALNLNKSKKNEHALALASARLNDAAGEQDLFNILGSVLANIPQLYIILDLEMLSKVKAGRGQQIASWPVDFIKLFDSLEEKGIQTDVKVVIVSYGSSDGPRAGPADRRSFIVTADRSLKAASIHQKIPIRKAKWDIVPKMEEIAYSHP